MLVVGSNQFVIDLKLMMVKEEEVESKSFDIEEGEISDESQSVEEITEEDFKPKGEDSRVWLGGDLFKYSNNYGSGNYGSGLYNFAWAQAVQNKPLSESLVREYEFANNELNQRSTTTTTSSSKEVCNVIIDDSSEEIDSNKVDNEKEEGELEEGEIELDSEMKEECGNSEEKMNDEEFEKRIIAIIETLETVTVNDAEKSFDQVCSRLQRCLDSLHFIVSECGVSKIGALIDQAFDGIEAIISVFNSLNSKQQEHNKEDLSRLVAHVKGQVPALFSIEQMKEIQVTMDSSSVLSSLKDMEVDEEPQISTGVKNKPGILGEKPPLIELGILGEKPPVVSKSAEKGLLQSAPFKLGDRNNSIIGPEILKQGLLSGSRSRGGFGPLLDLHGAHDVDSLPSPTREAPPPLYAREQRAFIDGNVKSKPVSKVASKSEEASMHRYETDALRAVSTYQQKFSRTSYHLSTRLPSPTPSDESDGGDGDCNGEVSSSFTVGNVRAIRPPVPSEAISSLAPQVDKPIGQVPVLAKTTGHIASGQTPHIRISSKSRDPRLRLANREVGASNLNARPLLKDTPKTDPVEGIINLRKNKNVGETQVDGQALKKQKNGSTNWEVSRDVQMARGGGWLENCGTSGTAVNDRIQTAESLGTDFRKTEDGGVFSGQRQVIPSSTFNAKTGGPEQLPLLPVTGTSTAVSLPSLLKDIVVNPTMLMQLIVEQQRVAAEAQRPRNLLQGTMPAFTSSLPPGPSPPVSVAPSKSFDVERKSVENSWTSTNPPSEPGSIRMKPRDPRRILHSSTFQKNESLESEQFKTNGAPMSSFQANTHNLSARQQTESAQASSLPFQSSPPPDIARQFTKNLRNLADILSSQSTDSISTVTQGGSVLVNTEKTDVGVSATDPKDQQNGTVLTPEGVIETSRPQNTWGDVEHLFERYDDKQKAAIQRERSRRIEEQNKMFAAKKLCLVLDLDHTLLNSAKFVEVEPMHEEILRKKEEQDREKPQRHLFRFSHMGMWTKLRPGIWTFLEKASKIYELHLYTMGNKLYATEMAKVLDPTGVLFAGRIISKGDDGDPFDSDDKLPKIKDLEGVLGMESSVVIIDDSVKVWPHNKLNLILVERYTYFPCSRRQFGLPGPSLLEIDHDERPEDGTLASSSAVIERLHQSFFSNPSLHEVDVRNILASEQRKILAGCRILFSRIFPVGEAKPQQHPLWQTAEQFGAVCTTQIDNLVTHVVANSLGTDKVNWAMSTGRYVVHPGWVEASALLYRRANEQDFAVKINLP